MSIHDVLAAGNITVLDARVNPRPGLFAPIGILCHHTANPQHGDLPSLHILQHGRSDLPGPLVQLGAGREGTIASVTDGRANHAGKGSDVVAARVRADLEPVAPGPDNTDGNTLFIGIEIENAGDHHEPYPAIQIGHVVKVCAVLCKHYGWTANRVIGHKEWTTRKPDPSFDMPALRAAIREALAPQPPPDYNPEVNMNDYYIIFYGDAPGPGDDTPARWAWWPSQKVKTFIDGDAYKGFQESKGFLGHLKLREAAVKAIANIDGSVG